MATYDKTQIQSGPADVMQERSLTGTGSVTSSSPNITGVGTKFQTELAVGQAASINGVDFVVLSIATDTAAVATTTFGATAATKAMTAFYNLGLTKDGVKEVVTTTGFVTTTDQLGDVGEIIDNRTVMLTINLAQWNADNLGLCFPEALPLLKGSSTFLSRLSPSIGLDIAGVGKRLQIIPVKGGAQTSDASLILNYWIVGPSTETQTLEWGKQKQRVLVVNLRAWPDPTHSNEFRYVGDRSLLS